MDLEYTKAYHLKLKHASKVTNMLNVMRPVSALTDAVLYTIYYYAVSSEAKPKTFLPRIVIPCFVSKGNKGNR